jgi:hypothetical protein
MSVTSIDETFSGEQSEQEYLEAEKKVAEEPVGCLTLEDFWCLIKSMFQGS